MEPRVVQGGAERGPVIAVGVVVGSLAILLLAAATNAHLKLAVPLVLLVIAAAVAYRKLLAWKNLLVLLVAVILFVPIRRYTLPGKLPFELEPYRLVIILIATGWLLSLLVDPRVRLRRTGLEAPLLLLVISVVGSDVANFSRFTALSSYVIKSVTFFASFLVVFYLVATVVRASTAERVLAFLTAGGAVVGIFAIIEARSNYNFFDHLHHFVPILKPDSSLAPSLLEPRGGRLRVYASAQHPIALGALFAMLIPFAIYFAQIHRRKLWWVVLGILVVATFSTVSRTTVVMLAVIAVVLSRLRGASIRRMWPAVIPLLLAIHVAAPGTLGSLEKSFFPKGGLIAQQQVSPGRRGSGRLADVGPSLHEVSRDPLFGVGYGTRLNLKLVPAQDAAKVAQDGLILDDQWLGTLLETGILGVAAWIAIFWVSCRRFAAAARRDPGPRGWLFAALTASVLSFAIAMFLFDAFAFIQITFVLFLLLALGFAILRGERQPARARVPATTPRLS